MLTLTRLAAMRETYAALPADSDVRLLIAEVDRLTFLNNRLCADLKKLGGSVLSLCFRLKTQVAPEMGRYEALRPVAFGLERDADEARETLLPIARRLNALERAA